MLHISPRSSGTQRAVHWTCQVYRIRNIDELTGLTFRKMMLVEIYWAARVGLVVIVGDQWASGQKDGYQYFQSIYTNFGHLYPALRLRWTFHIFILTSTIVYCCITSESVHRTTQDFCKCQDAPRKYNEHVLLWISVKENTVCFHNEASNYWQGWSLVIKPWRVNVNPKYVGTVADCGKILARHTAGSYLGLNTVVF